jgi:RNA polymerase sigma-70 factor (ECF subfamily)
VTLEERIQEHLVGGDPRAAATEAIRGFGPSVIRYLRSVLRDEDDAGDAFSRFAEKLWRSLPSFRGDCTLRAFCYRIAWSEAEHVRSDAYRQRRVRLRSGVASQLADEVRASSRGRRERQAGRLAELRAALDPHEQSLLTLRIDQDLSWREIAEVLAAPGEPAPTEAAVRKRFERTKDKVAAMARQRGFLE